MVIGPDFTRGVKPEEIPEIDELLRAAFGRDLELDFVKALRADGDVWMESVKPWGRIAGYVAYSRMRSPAHWACIAPLAVHPSCQNAVLAPSEAQKGQYAIGSRLAGEVKLLAEHGDLRESLAIDVPVTIVTLGAPKFYERCGFSVSRARNLSSPFPASCIAIARPGDDAPEEELVFPPAFDMLLPSA